MVYIESHPGDKFEVRSYYKDLTLPAGSLFCWENIWRVKVL